MIKLVLFDVEGVLMLPDEFFSVIYSRENGLDATKFDRFFRSPDWAECVTGKRDIKKHIVENYDLWNWSKSPDELLEYWFRVEDIRNHELLYVIQKIRKNGTKCHAATEQERYRTVDMRHRMFGDTLDGLHSTSEIGHKKNNPEFYLNLLERLRQDIGGLTPENILFFDDSVSKVEPAKSIGIDARVYKDNRQVLEDLRSRSVIL